MSAIATARQVCRAADSQQAHHMLHEHGPDRGTAATSITRLSLRQAERSSHRPRHTHCSVSSEAARPRAAPALLRASRSLGGIRRFGPDCRCHRKRLSAWGASTRVLQLARSGSDPSSALRCRHPIQVMSDTGRFERLVPFNDSWPGESNRLSRSMDFRLLAGQLGPLFF